MKLVKITVPVKPLVKAYLMHNFSDSLHLFPIVKLSRNSYVGKYFLNLLKGKRTKYEERMAEYNETIEIFIQNTDAEYFGFHLTNTGITDFNNYISEQIYFLMFMQCEILLETNDNIKIKQAITLFCSRYNFDESAMSYETAKKAYYRYRKNNDGKIRKYLK
jgi:hypothetical protein